MSGPAFNPKCTYSTSAGKDTSDQRLTYILRPNVTRPDFIAAGALDTPPITDESEMSAFEYASESDFISDRSDAEPDSDAEGDLLEAAETAAMTDAYHTLDEDMIYGFNGPDLDTHTILFPAQGSSPKKRKEL